MNFVNGVRSWWHISVRGALSQLSKVLQHMYFGLLKLMIIILFLPEFNKWIVTVLVGAVWSAEMDQVLDDTDYFNHVYFQFDSQDVPCIISWKIYSKGEWKFLLQAHRANNHQNQALQLFLHYTRLSEYWNYLICSLGALVCQVKHLRHLQ